jgi:hypothetical protein
LFVWTRPGEPYRVMGWSQGAFRISVDAASGEERVTQDSAALPIFNPASHTFQSRGIRNMRVAAFKIKLRHALED